MAKILFLGGSAQQVPAIEKAKEKGLFVITCDNIPENPGHQLADQFFNVSTTDREGVFQLAKEEEVDFVMSYASDPGAPVAAYVSEKLGLPGSSFSSVQKLSEKHLFRTILKENNILCPGFYSFSEDDLSGLLALDVHFPVIVKPVDSSGSKGVFLVDSQEDLYEKAQESLIFSRSKRIIVEEFIDAQLGDFHGDGLVVDNKLVFCYIGDHLYNKEVNPFNPMGTSWPTRASEDILQRLISLVEQVINLTGFESGPINNEARQNSAGDLYLMEIGPRSGGHFVPQAIELASGFDMVRASLDILLGKKIEVPADKGLFSCYYAINSEQDGSLEELRIDPSLEEYIAQRHIYKSPGDLVSSFQNSRATIGILLLVFPGAEKQEEVMSSLDKKIKVILSN